MKKDFTPLVIVGLGRSGSKLLKQILDRNSAAYIVPEMNFYSPYKNSIYKQYKKRNAKDRTVEFIDLLFSSNIQKTSQFLENIDKNKLVEDIVKNKEFSAKDLFCGLLTNYSLRMKPDAKVIGAKFPFHFSFLSTYLSWYPNSKIIFLIRDPRAILASELIMKYRQNGTSDFPDSKVSILNSITVFIYVVIQSIWYSKYIRHHRNADNVYLVYFENLILQPEQTIMDIANILGIQFEPGMLDIVVKGSSFQENEKKGFDSEVIRSWNNKLSTSQKMIMKATMKILAKEYKIYLKK